MANPSCYNSTRRYILFSPRAPKIHILSTRLHLSLSLSLSGQHSRVDSRARKETYFGAKAARTHTYIPTRTYIHTHTKLARALEETSRNFCRKSRSLAIYIYIPTHGHGGSRLALALGNSLPDFLAGACGILSLSLGNLRFYRWHLCAFLLSLSLSFFLRLLLLLLLRSAFFLLYTAALGGQQQRFGITEVYAKESDYLSRLLCTSGGFSYAPAEKAAALLF